jgi:transglutaminase-like putative cysteine protease
MAEAQSSAIERHFQVSLFLLLSTGFATLASTGRLDGLSLLLAGIGLVLRGWQLARNYEFRISERWTSWITLGYVLFYAADYFLFSARSSTPFVAATVHLVLFAMVVKIFSIQRDRDYVYLAVLAFLEVLAASVLTVDTIFLASFALFLLVAVNTLVSFELRHSARVAEICALSGEQQRRLPRSLSAYTLALVAGILLLAAGLFFVLPRAAGGYLAALATQSQVVSGFNNEVNLGSIGEIKQLNSVVMYVQFLGNSQAAPTLRWRGVTLGLFDGHRWFNPVQDGTLLSRADGRLDFTPLYPLWNDVLVPAHHRGLPHTTHYRVLMEPIGENVFFLAPKPQALLGPALEISADDTGAVRDIDRERVINSYEAISVIEPPNPAELRADSTVYPPEIQLRYLQLPKRLDPRVRELAEQVTQEAANPYDKAMALQSHLRTQYGYTLQLPSSPPPDPLANFLFERKRGHCEYFASAMAIMLRTLGIPARLVNGFLSGEFNQFTGSYVVRARDAHSWVEAYFPGHGWVTFDPTPGDPDAAAEASSRFMLYLDAGREFWREWIINYDFSHQRRLTYSTTLNVRTKAYRIAAWFHKKYAALLQLAERSRNRVRRAPQGWLAALFCLILALAVAVKSRQVYRALASHRLARHPERAPRSCATVWYERALRALARRGWRKQPAQTPAEFVASISDPALRNSLAEFTTHYERARFADSAEDAQRLPQLFSRIKGSTYNKKFPHSA